MKKKKCAQCFNIKDVEFFNYSFRSKDSLTAKCVDCLEDDAALREAKYGTYNAYENHQCVGWNGGDAEVYL